MRRVRRHDLVAERFEHLHGECAEVRIVLDHQNDLTTRFGPFGALGLRRHRGRRAVASRQVHPDQCSLTDVALYEDVSAGLPDETEDHTQAQTPSLALDACREEGLEDRFEKLGRNSLSSVSHIDPHVLIGDDTHAICLVLVREIAVRRGNRQRAAVGHRVARVDRQVEDRVLQLCAVCGDRPRIEVTAPSHLDRISHRLPHRTEQVSNQKIRPDPLRA